jgi:hypothetical protein
MSRFVSLALFTCLALLLVVPAMTSADDAEGLATSASVVPAERVPVPAVRAPVTAEEKALRELEESSRNAVDELVRSMTGMPDGPVLRALQHKVEEVKRNHRVDFLRLKQQFARQRGDLAAAQEYQRLVDLILNPPKPLAVPDSRAQERWRTEGGQP